MYRSPLIAMLVLLHVEIASGVDPVVSSIVQEWNQRQDRFSRVRYVIEGTSLRPRGFLNGHKDLDPNAPEGDYPPEDHISDTRIALLFNFRENWIRLERERDEYHVGEKFVRRLKIGLFDGQEFQFFKPADRNPPRDPAKGFHVDLERHANRAGIRLFESTEQPLFFINGMIPWPGTSNNLQKPVDPARFTLYDRIQHEERDLVVLRTAPHPRSGAFDEYWVDPAKGAAIVRHLVIDGDIEETSLVIEHELKESVWLPVRWTNEQRMPDGNLLYRDEMALVEYDFAPEFEKSLFHVEPKPGMIVEDGRTGVSVIYQGKDKPPLDAVEEWRRRQATGQTRSDSWFNWGTMLLCGGVAAMLIAGIVQIGHRRSRRNRST